MNSYVYSLHIMQQSILRPHNMLSYNNEMVLVHANNGNHNGYLIQQKKLN